MSNASVINRVYYGTRYITIGLEFFKIAGLSVYVYRGWLQIIHTVRKCNGAGDGARTRDNLLGRQELYH
jgi:hypothetical protein